MPHDPVATGFTKLGPQAFKHTRCTHKKKNVFLYKKDDAKAEFPFVAVKMVDINRGKKQTDGDRLKDLDTALLRIKGIDHQNLLRIYDRHFNESKELFVIVMEYCSGKSGRCCDHAGLVELCTKASQITPL